MHSGEKTAEMLLRKFYFQKKGNDILKNAMLHTLLLYWWVFLTFQAKLEVSWVRVNAITDKGQNAIFSVFKTEKSALIFPPKEDIMICK